MKILIKDSIKQYKKHFMTILISMMLYGLISHFINRLISFVNSKILKFLYNFFDLEIARSLLTISSRFVVILFSIFIFSPLVYGIYKLLLNVSFSREVSFKDLLYGVKKYIRVMYTELNRYGFSLLWSLLLIIPGIIKWYSFILTPYIVVDNENIKVREALKLSEKYMKGKKFKLFIFIFVLVLIQTLLTVGYMYLDNYIAINFNTEATLEFYQSTSYRMFHSVMFTFKFFVGYLLVVPIKNLVIANIYKQVKEEIS